MWGVLMSELVVALDVDHVDEAVNLARLCRSEGVRYVKVGMQLFYSAGAGVVGKLREEGVDVILDLKLHDIPNTMAQAARALCRLGPSHLTVHAAAGSKALAACVGAVADSGCKLLAVTVLTSTSQQVLNQELGVPGTIGDQVVRLARVALDAGISGIVCSVKDLADVKSRFHGVLQVMVPGVRPVWAIQPHDQARVATPAEARDMGADLVVVGRPVLAAEDRRKALRLLLRELKGESVTHEP